MKQKICFFDLLPVELIHTLFTYFLAHEILFSFSDVSDYLDTVLLTYSSYQLNFKSIQKSYFDLICCQIKPNQVISLTLSDDDDTPGQSELFLSRFRLQQFTHLQSLSLYNVETDALELIFTDLNKLDQLRSFSFHIKNVKQKCPSWIYDYSNLINRLKTLVMETYVHILPQLNQLSISSHVVLKSISFRHLHYLTLTETTVDELQMIFIQTPDLKSLNVTIDGDISNITNLHPPSQLNRLSLTINHPQVSINHIEQFIQNLPSLTHLTLQAECSIDMVDGYRWETLCHHLITFHLKFTIIIQDVEQTLETFRTPFWLQEKRWYVAYDHGHLYSIPKFAPKSVFTSYNAHFFTSPDDTYLYKNITKLIAFEPLELNTQNFTHIVELEIQDYFIHGLWSLLNIDRSQSSHRKSLNDTDLLLFYLHKFPHCHKLSINKSLTLEFLDKLSGCRFEQIRTLDIYSSTIITRYMIEELLCIFPHVEHLRIASVGSKRDMIRLLDGFKYLSNASITIERSFGESERQWFYKAKLALDGVRRLEHDAYTCRYQRSDINYRSSSIHIWINREMEKPCWQTRWPPQCGYRWYRIMRLVSRHPAVDFIQILCFANLFFKIVLRSVAPLLNSKSMYINVGSAITIYTILYIISTIVLSRLEFLRTHVAIIFALQFFNVFLSTFVKNDFDCMIYLSEKLERWLHL